MRPLVFLVLFALVCAINANVRIVSCRDLCHSFTHFMPSATDNAHNCDKTRCGSSRITFMTKRIEQLHAGLMVVDGDDVRVNLTKTDASKTDALADLLVLSILGRVVTQENNLKNVGDNIVYYKYDENEDGIRPVYGNCSFQKTMYVTLLIITIGILVVILAIQQQQPPPPPVSVPLTPNPGATPKMHFSLSQTTPVRYRSGSQR